MGSWGDGEMGGWGDGGMGRNFDTYFIFLVSVPLFLNLKALTCGNFKSASSFVIDAKISAN